ncbi:basic amino acid ABC transporter substrate-binding protein [Haloferax volcanii]|uniref:Basic amino acid ABC transporter substrate-binding protein n=3 Tax=Haloferax volcanii TaxID=2246 RepID=A0A6C0UV36_HALVO|nr:MULTISPECIES: basic amino acid ABC transporter substrate-binding protein [Haloferax]ELK54174.1 ABC-type glutamine/glutamate/polar amino acids transport system, substrate-binding protein [Haloferax sp. BAB-2207]ELZ76151.1 ABC-type glutamine/glutamate/polar amino acids transport system, substrate-binding protein [Haloferax lucentense DSM 14919]ELZ87125.1 ABC-type glutamine/glutamate/polar amino acids transport system, substrate-binding protein [Haloferax alexandrinus JCM 10717]NLV04014.1 trans
MERRTFLKGSAGAAAAFTLAGCLGGGGGSGSETITIGSDIPYRPFEYETTEGELVGFDVDIAEAVFGELGYEHEFQKTSFDSIIPSLNNGNFRVIMSAMTITEDRAEQIDFSDPYFTAYQTVIVLNSSDISSKEDLRGVTVGVQKGTTGESAATSLKEEFGGDLTIQSYDQVTGAFDALRNNQVSAVVNDNTVNAAFVDQSDNVRFLEGPGAAEEQGKENAPPYLTLTVEEYGIGFRQDDDELREEVNGALQTIRDNGTYDEIYSEYFSG